MKKLEEFVEKLKKFNSETKEVDCYALFKDLAEMLISQGQIKSVNGKEYNIEEIEFYFRNKRHDDTSTHMHNCDVAKWRAHYSGIDITFGSFYKGAEIPKTPTKDCGENIVYGGILIRSLSMGNNKFINGPLRVLTTLYSGNDIGVLGNGLVLSFKDARQCIIKKTTRCGVNNPAKFKDKEYCFYNANTCKDWLPQYLKDKNNVNRIPNK